MFHQIQEEFLANIIDDMADGSLRVTIQQNFVVRWVPDNALASFYTELKNIDLADRRS